MPLVFLNTFAKYLGSLNPVCHATSLTLLSPASKSWQARSILIRCSRAAGVAPSVSLQRWNSMLRVMFMLEAMLSMSASAMTELSTLFNRATNAVSSPTTSGLPGTTPYRCGAALAFLRLLQARAAPRAVATAAATAMSPCHGLVPPPSSLASTYRSMALTSTSIMPGMAPTYSRLSWKMQHCDSLKVRFSPKSAAPNTSSLSSPKE